MTYEKESAGIIARARKQKNMTQKELADIIGVSDKAVSKWETGGGCPDIRILPDLAEVLSIDEKTLLSGIAAIKSRDNGNMKNLRFYLCPSCGNIVTSTAGAEISCCSNKLKALEINKTSDIQMNVTEMDSDYFVEVKKEEQGYPMTKEEYILFVAYVTGDMVRVNRLFPEQSAEARFVRRGHGYIYACTNAGEFVRKLI